MARKPGTIAKMDDGQMVIIRDHQPLAQEHGKIVVELIDEEFRPMLREDGQVKIRMFAIDVYNEIIQQWTVIGKVD